MYARLIDLVSGIARILLDDGNFLFVFLSSRNNPIDRKLSHRLISSQMLQGCANTENILFNTRESRSVFCFQSA